MLSFACRLQLIQSVLYSIQAFWSNVFIRPKKTKGYRKKLASFLWKGSDDLVKGEKVAWDVICCPKKEGELGLKRLEEWNKSVS